MSNACTFSSGLYIPLDRWLMGRQEKGNNKAHSGRADCGSEQDRLGALDGRPSTVSIDRWLNEKLTLLYGPVLSEPIPEDLVELIETHRRFKEGC